MTQLFAIRYPDSISSAALASAKRTYREARALLDGIDASTGVELKRELSNAIGVLRREMRNRSAAVQKPAHYTESEPVNVQVSTHIEEWISMVNTVHERVETLPGRPPIQLSSTASTSAFGDVLREDLESLASVAATAVRHCDELSRSAPALRSLDMQRDVLHLQARIAGLARQIEDAKETLERLQQRTATGPSSRKQLKQPFL